MLHLLCNSVCMLNGLSSCCWQLTIDRLLVLILLIIILDPKMFVAPLGIIASLPVCSTRVAELMTASTSANN